MLNKILLKYSNILILVILLTGFGLISLTSYVIYGDASKNDTEIISSLASSNIYSDICAELTKPVVISQTMAHDSFLVNWIKHEEDDKFHSDEMTSYLAEYKRKYDYDSFFTISAKTGNYYHHDGLHKKVSRSDAHDVWFYNFIESGEPYALNVDFDEANSNILTVFADSRIEDMEGNLLGVVGVGVKMKYLQNILRRYYDRYKVESFIVDQNGTIKIHMDEKFIKHSKLHDIYPNMNINLTVEVPQNGWFNNDGEETFAVISYIPEIKAYLVVMDNTERFFISFKKQIFCGLLIICSIAALLTVSSACISNHYRKLMIDLSNTDELTSLSNRRKFESILEKIIQNHYDGNSFLFVFDIDDFKAINDNYGHVLGDYVLKKIGEICIQVLGSARNIYRVGGDEFCGIVHLELSKTQNILERLREEVNSCPELKKYGVAISFGLTRILADDTIDSVLIRADKAMYKSKQQGKNRLTFFDKGE